MNAELHRYLLEQDALGWEYPETKDQLYYENLWRQIRILRPRLQELVGHALLLDEGVQDAAYITEIAWPDERVFDVKKRSGVWRCHFAVRFSTFGEMATIYSDTNDLKAVLRHTPTIVELLETHGFKYIPIEVLQERYDGTPFSAPEAPNSTWQMTWFLRFFDYL